MIFESALEKQEQHILARFQQVYHLPLERAEQEFRGSAFYRLLINPDTNLWRDDAEQNFQTILSFVQIVAFHLILLTLLILMMLFQNFKKNSQNQFQI